MVFTDYLSPASATVPRLVPTLELKYLGSWSLFEYNNNSDGRKSFSEKYKGRHGNVPCGAS